MAVVVRAECSSSASFAASASAVVLASSAACTLEAGTAAVRWSFASMEASAATGSDAMTGWLGAAGLAASFVASVIVDSMGRPAPGSHDDGRSTTDGQRGQQQRCEFGDDGELSPDSHRVWSFLTNVGRATRMMWPFAQDNKTKTTRHTLSTGHSVGQFGLPVCLRDECGGR
jgi:hypothetical protein